MNVCIYAVFIVIHIHKERNKETRIRIKKYLAKDKKWKIFVREKGQQTNVKWQNKPKDE